MTIFANLARLCHSRQMYRNDVAIFIFVIGLVVFNAPFLMVFDQHLLHYLFAAWTAMIILIMILARRSGSGTAD